MILNWSIAVRSIRDFVRKYLRISSLDIQNKTLHFVERAEPIPPPAPATSSHGASSGIGGGLHDGGMNQAMMDEVNETTSIFINAFPGAVNLQPNDIQVRRIFHFDQLIHFYPM